MMPTSPRTRTILLLWTLVAVGGVLFLWRTKTTDAYQVRAFSTAAGWGYEVSQDGNALIYQPYKPGVAGKQGFTSEAQAQRVGQRVVSKLRQGQFPPTLRSDELN